MSKRTLQPYVTGSSVLGVRYSGGVMICCDTQAAYGSSQRYKDVPRIATVGAVAIACSGEYSDFQQIEKILERQHTEAWVRHDGHLPTPHEVASYLTRVFYARRCKANPLYNTAVVAGASHLAYADLYGTTFEDDFVATGLGAYFALPLLRAKARPTMSEQEARELLIEAMTILFARDTMGYNKVQIARVTAAGPVVEEPVTVTPQWELRDFLRPTAEMTLAGNSW